MTHKTGTRKTEKTLHDVLAVNALVMGSGPALAVLESMFNLVQAQSVLSASMVRDHEMNQPLMMDALAVAMNEILDPCCGRRRCRMGVEDVAVDIPARTDAPSPAAGPGADELVEALKSALAQSAPGQGGGQDTTTATMQSTTQSAMSGEQVEHLLLELLEMLGDHMSEITRNTRQPLMVT